MNLRLSVAIALGKGTAAITRAVGVGGGTTLPGRVARGVAPDVISGLASRLRHGTIVVTGTNGKTTTSRLISHILEHAGLVVVHNRAGANLAAGIAASLVQQSTLGGMPRGDIGIFEVDEATLPRVTPALRPRVVVLTNLFRDQLDRYGEIDIVATRWRTALQGLDAQTAVIFNADDPLVSDVGRERAGPTIPFGIEDDSCGLGTIEHTADARYCYRCGIPYVYSTVYFGHMGLYHCPQCGTTRPAPVVTATHVTNRGLDGTTFTLAAPEGSAPVGVSLPGVYNIHNVLAAAACSLQVGVPLEIITRALSTFAPAFGRAERVRIDGRETILLLAKNPAGFNEVLRTVLRAQGQVALIAINDLTADGRDISWLWDVDFEMLAGRLQRVVVSGLRAEDMALRLKYAGVSPDALVVEKDLARALTETLSTSTNGAPLYILPTYTALLHLRKILHARGYVRGFWED